MDTGLRDVVVGTCWTSYVDPQKGVHYCDIPISELANSEPEKVIYLLLYRKEASEYELKEFKEELVKRSHIDPEVLHEIKGLSRNKDPMALLSQALHSAGMEKTEDYREDCLNIIARMPEIIATVINHHAGWGETPESNPSLGYMENFAHMLNVPNADKHKLIEVFKLFNILHYDHGGGNLSAFVGKATASGLADLYGSLSSAMDALAGARHGKANRDSLTFLKKISSKLGENITQEKVQKLLEEEKVIPGFGHRVLRQEDARATILYDYAQKHYGSDPLVNLASIVRRAGEKVLGERTKVQDPHANVDGISGTVLEAAGFPYPQYFTVLFGLSRCVGLAIQILNERLKGVPIYRPVYTYEKG